MYKVLEHLRVEIGVVIKDEKILPGVYPVKQNIPVKAV